MIIFRNSLPLLFLAAVFSFNECKRLESVATTNLIGGVLPETTALLFKSKSANLRRTAAVQVAARVAAQRAAREAKTSFIE